MLEGINDLDESKLQDRSFIENGKSVDILLTKERVFDDSIG